jgi:hypothetical protein
MNCVTYRLWAAAGGVQQSMLQAIQVVLLAGGASIAPAIIGAVKDLLMGLLADKVTHSGISTTTAILTSAPGLRSHPAHICAGTAISPRPHLRRD